MDVLVVGAGPSGLLMAGELARHGLSCRLIDANEHASTQSRALAIQARTVEMLDDLGLAEAFLARGLEATAVNISSSAGPIARVDLAAMGGPYPFMLDLPQDETEALLTEHAEALGVEVEREHELMAFEQDDDGVTATVRGPGGEEAVRVPWVVGCDGAHSTVRHALGFAFEGSTVDLDWGLADVAVNWDGASDELHMFLLSDGVLAMFPIPGSRWRLIAEIGAATADRAPTPELRFFTDYLRRAGIPDADVTDPHWIAGFRVNERQAAHIRGGRAFTVGDASHVHSPAGGQGMNTGLQDGYNLAWKLALVQRGQAPAALLDTYEAERRPVAERVVKSSSALFKLGLIDSEVGRHLRDTAMRHLAGLDAVQRRMTRSVSERDINYRDSPIVRERQRPHGAPRAGDLAPDAGPELRAVLRGTAHVLLVFDDVAETGAGFALCDAIDARWKSLVQSHLVTRGGELDPDGTAHEAYGGAAAALVRPDGYVAYVSGDCSVQHLDGYLSEMLVSPASAS